jgi:hypothetical protein
VQARRDALDAMADLGGDQEAFTPAVNEWPLLEILEYLLLP